MSDGTIITYDPNDETHPPHIPTWSEITHGNDSNNVWAWKAAGNGGFQRIDGPDYITAQGHLTWTPPHEEQLAQIDMPLHPDLYTYPSSRP